MLIGIEVRLSKLFSRGQQNPRLATPLNWLLVWKFKKLPFVVSLFGFVQHDISTCLSVVPFVHLLQRISMSIVFWDAWCDAWCICYFIFLVKLFASSQNICRNPVIRVIDAKFVTLSPVIADEIDSIIRFCSVCLGPLVERVVETVSLMLHKMRVPFCLRGIGRRVLPFSNFS